MTATRQAERLKRFRDRRDEFMRTHESSPLTDTQKESFVPLDYYDENPDLRFELVPDMEIDHTGRTGHDERHDRRVHSP
ncbi:MAG: hypothetical protein R2849_15525 [Thermomicrobiales bacterium]